MIGDLLIFTLPRQLLSKEKYVLGGEGGGEAIPS